MGGLKIGQLAGLAGCTVKAVRFYEAQGLLPPPARSPSGYRVYTERDLKRLQFVLKEELEGFLVNMRRARPLPEELCACAGEAKPVSVRLLKARPKGGLR